MTRTLLLLPFLLVSLACSGNGPDSIEGTYTLESLRGAALPYDDTLGCCIYDSGSLLLTGFTYRVSLDFHNKNNGLYDTAFETGTYSQDGDSLHFHATGGNQPFLLGDATATGTTIGLSLGGEGPGTPDSFRAVFHRR